MEFLAVSIVVLSGAPDRVPKVVEDTELTLDASAFMVDSLTSMEVIRVGGARVRKLESSSTSCNMTVFVTVKIIYGVDRLPGFLDVENPEKGSPTVFVTPGTADVEKQPIPIKEKSRQIGTFRGQHCGSGRKLFVQFDEM